MKFVKILRFGSYFVSLSDAELTIKSASTSENVAIVRKEKSVEFAAGYLGYELLSIHPKSYQLLWIRQEVNTSSTQTAILPIPESKDLSCFCQNYHKVLRSGNLEYFIF